MQNESPPEDLSEKGSKRRIPMVSKTTAIIIFGILTTGGIAIGVFLPGEQGENDTKVPKNHELSVLISSSIPKLEIEEDTYTDIPLPTASYIIMEKGASIGALRDNLDEMILFMMGNQTLYRMMISPGSGWEEGTGPLEISSNRTPEDGPDDLMTKEVAVEIDSEREVTLIFELEVWKEVEK